MGRLRRLAETRLRLVDIPGFTGQDEPLPRGEVVVSSPSLALGPPRAVGYSARRNALRLAVR
jgi:hypothetical protein